MDIKPAGRFVAADVDKAGGIPVIAKRLVEGKLVDGSALTVTGRTLAEEAAEARETPGQEVILPLDKALKPRGGIAILRGNLAPEGCVIKLAGHDKMVHQGPARVFDREEDARRAVMDGKIQPGDVVIIRYEGPRGGPGMREMLASPAPLWARASPIASRCDRRPLQRRHPRLHDRPRGSRGLTTAAPSRPCRKATPSPSMPTRA